MILYPGRKVARDIAHDLKLAPCAAFTEGGMTMAQPTIESDPLAIPPYLIISQEKRAEAWRGKRTHKISGEPVDAPKINTDSEGRALPTNMTPEAWALLKEAEKVKDDKKKAFFKAKEAERKAAKA
jgi:hypothetical protein